MSKWNVSKRVVASNNFFLSQLSFGGESLELGNKNFGCTPVYKLFSSTLPPFQEGIPTKFNVHP